MQIEEYKSLKSYNTFGVAVKARYFISVNSVKALKKALKSKVHERIFILGGGSNMLLTSDIDALVIHINIEGREIIQRNDSSVLVKIGGGEIWHEFVLYAIENDFGGVENLSLIPGNVGTAPIQNIGAYGVELVDVFESCSAVHRETCDERIFTKDEMRFAYRDSIFKNELKDTYVITDVTFRLTTKNHKINTSYGDIQKVLLEKEITEPTLRAISEAVISIRRSKLPDPKVLGNSGSFFKNPIVDKKTFELFIEKFPQAPFYKVSDLDYKIPAGWLIEKAGFKGKQWGDAGVHKNQALVLVNYGNATGKEILELAQHIQEKVWEFAQIKIEPEVNIF